MKADYPQSQTDKHLGSRERRKEVFLLWFFFPPPKLVATGDEENKTGQGHGNARNTAECQEWRHNTHRQRYSNNHRALLAGLCRANSSARLFSSAGASGSTWIPVRRQTLQWELQMSHTALNVNTTKKKKEKIK